MQCSLIVTMVNIQETSANSSWRTYTYTCTNRFGQWKLLSDYGYSIPEFKILISPPDRAIFVDVRLELHQLRMRSYV